MLGRSRLIHRSLFISFCCFCVPILLYAKNLEHQALFALHISDKNSSQVLDFLSEIGLKDAYDFTDINPRREPRSILHEVIRQVYEYNPDILISRADIGIAKEVNRQALGQMLPKVNSDFSASVRREKFEFGGSSSSRNDPDDFSSSPSNIFTDRFVRGSLSVVQPIFRGGTLYRDFLKTKDELAATEFAREAVTQNLFLNAIVSHLDVLENLAVAAVSKHSFDVLRRFDEETQARFRSGLLTRTDVSQSKARLKRSQADFDQALARYKKSREDFERIVGFPADAAANIPEVYFRELIEFDALEKIVLRYHPLIRQAEKQAEAAKNEIEARFGVLLPSADVVLEGANNFKRGYQTSKYSGEARVQVGIPIYSGGVNFSAFKQAKIAYQRALNQLDRVRREIRDNLNSVRYDYEISEHIINARMEEVKAAFVAFDGSRKEWKVGRRTVLDTLDSETDLLDANISYISASFNRKKLIFQYLDAMGCLNHNILRQAIE